MISRRIQTVVAIVLLAGTAPPVAAQELILRLDPKDTRADFTLSATMHSVEGSFALKRGEIRFDPSSGKVSGEIVFDAASGQSGNDRRDHKMHKDVLESELYPEITFRPEKVGGAIALQGSSNVTITGIFAIHGIEQPMTVPVQLTASPDKWAGEVHFLVPYAKWGMKNPSTFLLHVAGSVDVTMHFSGAISPSR